MPDRPSYFLQETPYSCVPACLRMVLGSFGISKTEEELRALCDCTIWGTRSENAIDGLRKLGFTRTEKQNLDFHLLGEQLEMGRYPIVFVGVRFRPDTHPEKHAVIVVKIGENGVEVLDPLRGEIILSHEEFEAEWSYMRRLTILVK
jgi:ABC-type bacteriocin/lantibiotic exporter with double-glycine peptidase domain